MINDDNPFRRVDWSGDQPLPSDDDDEHGMPLQPRGPGLSAADLELLTLAARALGARAEAVEGEQWMILHFADGTEAHGWNPLLFRGDTFELACDCFVALSYGGDFVTADGPQRPATELFDRQDKESRRAAAARAIVRAAAEIGKAMA
jgi:hypothetical protein